nr:bifunctional precorrin-2 dehydrogenase/sirohydrochlorin ferrochelatase [uncultured Mediterraneibacter sp.]
MKKPYFPMFIDLTDKRILVAGGGNIALRRVRILLQFGADICVVAPEVCKELTDLADSGKITARRRPYRSGDIRKARLVLAATDDHEVNQKIWKECKKEGIMVNVANDRRLCDFCFPSVVMTDEAVIGVNSVAHDPSVTKRVRKNIEKACGVQGTSGYK